MEEWNGQVKGGSRVSKRKTVTLRDLADRLGLSVYTVSKALRGLPGMSEPTRRLVFATARAMNYATKAQEAGLAAESIAYAAGKPRRFVMLMPADHSLLNLQFHGLHQRMDELGHQVQSVLLPFEGHQPDKLADWLEESGILYCDGLFLSPLLPVWAETILLQLGLPKVMINFPPEGAEVDSVIWDVQHAIILAVNALCRSGHRRILYVGEPDGQRGFRLRYQSFRAACASRGISAAEQMYHVNPADPQWLADLSAILQTGSPTAILSANHGQAWPILRKVQEWGLNIPEQISIVAMEHGELEACPGLSRPALLVQEAGERAAELMLRRIANPLAPYEQIRLLGPFLTGETVAEPSLC